LLGFTVVKSFSDRRHFSIDSAQSIGKLIHIALIVFLLNASFMMQETNTDPILVDNLLLLQTTSPLLLVGRNMILCFCFFIRKCKATLVAADNDQVRANNDRVVALSDSLKWINVQATLLDICIAFHPLDLPPYVVLEIVDRFPFWSTHVNHKKKIDYIIQIKRFCDDLIRLRIK
jgi:hypothetical protein